MSLSVPIDWNQDPFGNRSWRMYLHALDAIEPLLVHYDQTKQTVALEQAAAIAEDWIEHNPRGGDGVSEFAWYDMAVSYRAARLAYLYRALVHEHLMTPALTQRLGCALTEHGDWLRDDKNYKFRNNHGLYTDAGLYIVAQQLDRHPRAADWARRATERFIKNVRATVSTTDGVHLEHSPSYHMLITELLDKLINELGIGRDELSPLLDRMRQAAPWFVMPDGKYPQLGDTNLGPAPAWVARVDGDDTGFRAFADAGAAVYRDGASYFATAAWYHSRSHKHSDDGTFVWAERGRRLVVDAGRYGYFYDEPGRVYAESSPAHNTLTLEPPFHWRSRKPYGSGIIDSASTGGWHAVLLTNPMLEDQRASHRRVLAYRPGRHVVVIDQLTASPCPESTRHFHFAPGLAAMDRTATTARLAREADGDTVWLQTAPAPRALRILSGQKQPEVRGFTFPSDRKWIAVADVDVVDARCGEPMVVALSANAAAAPDLAVTAAPGQATVRIGDDELHVLFAGNELTLNVESHAD